MDAHIEHELDSLRQQSQNDLLNGVHSQFDVQDNGAESFLSSFHSSSIDDVGNMGNMEYNRDNTREDNSESLKDSESKKGAGLESSMDFLNGMGAGSTAGSPPGNLGMAGVMAALQSLGSNSNTPQESLQQGQGQLREQIMLEQFKLAQLQQLQQLQQQIFQQQMALINGGNQDSFHGLPTPGSSTELRPVISGPIEFVSPMLLNHSSTPSSISTSTTNTSTSGYDYSPHPNTHHNHNLHRGTASAPAHIAFGNPLTEPASPAPELDFDISPLTSPWLGADSGVSGRVQAYHHHHPSTSNSNSGSTTTIGGKRPASPGNLGPARKRQQSVSSPNAIRPSITRSSRVGGSGTTRSLSTNSTPLLRGTNPSSGSGRRGSVGLGGGINMTMNNMNMGLGIGMGSTGSMSINTGTNLDLSSSPLMGALGTGSGLGAGSGMPSPMDSPMVSPMATGYLSSSGHNRGHGGHAHSHLPSPSLSAHGHSQGHGSRHEHGHTHIHNHGYSPANLGFGFGTSMGSGIGIGVVGDSPSPVDLSLSMPPPAPPASASASMANSSIDDTNSTSNSTDNNNVLLPVTPSMIMNLPHHSHHPLGSRSTALSVSSSGSGAQLLPLPSNPNSSNPSSTNTTASEFANPNPSESPNSSKPSKNPNSSKPSTSSNASTASSTNSSTATSKGKGKGTAKGKDVGAGSTAVGTRKSGRKAAAANGNGGTGADTGTTTLKAILPAGAPTSGLPGFSNPDTASPQTFNAPSTHISGTLPLKERKTSHKAAEQKRRDSLKSTFDDLRRLLPPIPLPSSLDANSALDPAHAQTEEVVFTALARASLLHGALPGALPPRGPPNKGGEGPNKGVSKLQLLICGNEYIRVLEGRVERRDQEVKRLREEVQRLRGLQGSDVDSGRDEFELEKDLDAVETMALNANMPIGAMSAAGNASANLARSGTALSGVDEDVEED